MAAVSQASIQVEQAGCHQCYEPLLWSSRQAVAVASAINPKTLCRLGGQAVTVQYGMAQYSQLGL